MPYVNPEVLVWARETAGLSKADAAKALSIGGKKASGEELLTAYELGEKELSRPLLVRMAKVYRRPLLTFYLPRPPAQADLGEDFRTLPDHLKQESSGLLTALVRDIHVRKELIKNALVDMEEARTLAFVGELHSSTPAAEAAQLITKRLNFSLDEFRAKNRPEDAFSYTRHLVEDIGVFVLLAGNLGSHHTDIPVEVFRGFALSDDQAPFIVINDQDAPAARSFTLLHELAHIFLGATGISGSDTSATIERYCNDISSLILLPAEELLNQFWSADNERELVRDVANFASERNISGSLVAYRLFSAGVIDEPMWSKVSGELRRLWLMQKAAKKQKAKEDTNSGPSYYVVKRYKLGHSLVDFVGRTVQEGILTASKAGKILDVKPGNVYNLIGA